MPKFERQPIFRLTLIVFNVATEPQKTKSWAMKALLLALLLGLAPALAAENAWEPKPRSRWYPWMSLATWAAKHNATLVRAREGKVDLLFLGDSITEGWSDTSVWQKHYARRNAANFGIGGDTTQNLLWRIENGALERISPKVVVLLIGTNNLGLSGDAPNDVVKGCTAVVSSIRRRLPQSKVLLVGILPRDEYPNTSFRKAIATVNQHISKLNDGQSIRFLDIGNKFYPPPPEEHYLRNSCPTVCTFQKQDTQFGPRRWNRCSKSGWQTRRSASDATGRSDAKTDY